MSAHGEHSRIVANVDEAVADFTKKLLGVAREEGVDFQYVGKRPTRTDEVLATLQENVKVAGKLMGKKT